MGQQLGSIDPRGLVLLATLARVRSVRGAGLELGVPRSTVSRQIAALEKAVEAPLVIRTSRRLALTELGYELAARGQRLDELLGEAAQLASRASREPTGALRIAAGPIFGEELLPAVLADYLRRYPRMRVEVELSADYIDVRSVDLAIRFGPIDSATDLYATRLGESDVGYFAGPEYVEERGLPAEPAEIAAHDCIVVGGRRVWSWSFKSRGRQVRVPIVPRIQLDSFRLARAVAAESGGVARLARFFATEQVARGELVPVLEPHWPRLPVFAVHSSGRTPPLKIRTFVDLLRPAMRSRLRVSS
jgi:DNA-binding transcriptional LysR family regulator